MMTAVNDSSIIEMTSKTSWYYQAEPHIKNANIFNLMAENELRIREKKVL